VAGFPLNETQWPQVAVKNLDKQSDRFNPETAAMEFKERTAVDQTTLAAYNLLCVFFYVEFCMSMFTVINLRAEARHQLNIQIIHCIR